MACASRVDGWCRRIDVGQHHPDAMAPGMLPALSGTIGDVMVHFGLKDPACGFVAEFIAPDVTDVQQLGLDLRVLGGGFGTLDGVPLRLAPVVSMALRSGA